MHATMIGLDIAKRLFRAFGEDREGKQVLSKRLSREQVEAFFAKQEPATIGIEACGSTHHWARRLSGLGHTVRLIPGAYVRPFVRRNKTDARDAEATCEAMQHPGMRFVPIKSMEQQAARGLESTRNLLVRQRTQLANAMRGLLAEYGIIAAQGKRGFEVLAGKIEQGDPAIPTILRHALSGLLEQWRAAGSAADALDAQIVARARADATARRLMTIPGIGPLGAHAIVAAIGDGTQFRRPGSA